MAGKLQDRVAVITGAGTGIGKAIAIAYAREGANVVGAGRRVEKLQETAREVESLGRKFLAVKCDITKKEDCNNVIAQAIKKFGRIDILVNNAAYYRTKAFLEITPEEWDFVLATDLKGYVLMSQAVLPHMIKQKKGNIIMTNSSHIRAQPASTTVNHYVAAKRGVQALTRSLAAEFGPMGIRVNGFCPGFTPDTEQAGTYMAVTHTREWDEAYLKTTPLRRFGRSEDYQGIALFLASDDSDYITGQTIAVDGGSTMR